MHGQPRIVGHLAEPTAHHHLRHLAVVDRADHSGPGLALPDVLVVVLGVDQVALAQFFLTRLPPPGCDRVAPVHLDHHRIRRRIHHEPLPGVVGRQPWVERHPALGVRRAEQGGEHHLPGPLADAVSFLSPEDVNTLDGLGVVDGDVRQAREPDRRILGGAGDLVV